jgi:hypothetical protein
MFYPTWFEVRQDFAEDVGVFEPLIAIAVVHAAYLAWFLDTIAPRPLAVDVQHMAAARIGERIKVSLGYEVVFLRHCLCLR